MGPYRFLWVLMNPNGSLRVFIDFYAFLCVLMGLIGLYESLWILIGFYAS